MLKSKRRGTEDESLGAEKKPSRGAKKKYEVETKAKSETGEVEVVKERVCGREDER